MPRTDPHRPSVIVPSHYRSLLSYSLRTIENSWPVPSHRFDCVLEFSDRQHRSDRCCVMKFQAVARSQEKQIFGGPGRCGVCGTRFIYGDLYEHTLTGDLVHMGQDCADKYSLLADRGEWSQGFAKVRAKAALEMIQEQKREAVTSFFSDNTGLEEDLSLGDKTSDKQTLRILADLSDQLRSRGFLSDKQVALARKLGEEIRHPVSDPVLAVAPLGKTEFIGEIVSAKFKLDEIYGGGCFKVLIQVSTPNGIWKAWGTLPTYIEQLAWRESSEDIKPILKGLKVKIKATLEAKKYDPDPSFVIMKRPTMMLVGIYGPIQKKTRASKES